MDKYGKQSGIKDESIDTSMTFMKRQIDENRQEIERLRHENAAVKENAAQLAATCRSLRNEINARNEELRRLEFQYSGLQERYEESLKARREYDRYINTVGQVYMAACDSAQGIVDRAGSSADTLLDALSHASDQAGVQAEQTISLAKEARGRLAETLPSLMETINRTFKEIDDFLETAQSIPRSFEKIEEIRREKLSRIRQDAADFRRRSQFVVSNADTGGGASAAPTVAEGARGSEGAVRIPEEIRPAPPEREKLHKEQEHDRDEPEALPSEMRTAGQFPALQQSPAEKDGQPVFTPVLDEVRLCAFQRRPNVRELLNKYSRLK